MDSDNIGGRGVYGGCENCVSKCSLKSWGKKSLDRRMCVFVCVSIILKWILEMLKVRLGTSASWSEDAN
jgi:hypothetical protein